MTRAEFKYGGLMRFFEEISSIPRPTFREERIAEYLCDFARQRGLEYYKDAANNVFIRKPATQGRETEEPVLLQGHTDMVCEKNEGVEHDFLSEGLKLYEENGKLRARGTTLGADNGDAVAAMLYILDGAEGYLPSHPPIECLFTASEEVGLDGAKSFDYSLVRARRMINMDSADERQILTGCAGGMRTTLVQPLTVRAVSGETVAITLKGLAGGHSGEDIDKGRANANKLMGRLLSELCREMEISLVSVDGGSKDNAITRECRAVVVSNDTDGLKRLVDSFSRTVVKELCHEDRGFRAEIETVEPARRAMSEEDTQKAIFLLDTVQNGIFEMNVNIKGLVEYSRNMGVVQTAEDLSEIRYTFLTRSPQDSQIKASLHQLELYADMLGMEVKHGNYYPGWTYAEVSDLRDAYAAAYRKLFGGEVEITTIHAGLECGIIKEKLPDMDMISCGPRVTDLHSPDEAMDIESFERFFSIIIEMLAN